MCLKCEFQSFHWHEDVDLLLEFDSWSYEGWKLKKIYIHIYINMEDENAYEFKKGVMN